jgi:murein DD-endopeptidase MepM/ murein hydrolase activator NlpD
MNFKSKETKTKIWLAFLVLAAGLFVVSPAGADTRQDLQNKLSNLNSKIGDLSQNVARLRQQGASLKNEIDIYDSQIQSTELQIQANNTRITDINLQIEDIQVQIERRQNEIADSRKILSELVVQLNELDANTFLTMTLGSDNFSAFLDQVQYTKSVNQQVYDLVQRIKEVKQKLQDQQDDLKAQLQRLSELKEELEQNQTALDDQKSGKQVLLDQTKGQESKYQKALSASRNEQADVQREIQNLDSKAGAPGSKSIAASKGVLAWPMQGVMTQGYGNTGFTSLGYTFHNGIDIAGPAGTPIYVPADGTVVRCATGAAAYGNWCAIKHTIATASGPRQIVTLFGHMTKFALSGGQTVKRGDFVGYEGNTGNTSRLLYGPDRGYHLHFSVFDADGFTITPGKYPDIYGPYSVPSGYTYNPLNFLGK